MKILLKNQKEKFVEPDHLIAPPETPIPSIKLANVLNPSTPVGKLISSSKHEDPFVRRAVVRNPSLPIEEIKKLTKDPDPLVAAEAKKTLSSRKEFDPQDYVNPAI